MTAATANLVQSTAHDNHVEPSVPMEVSQLLLDALSAIDDDSATAFGFIERASTLLGPSLVTKSLPRHAQKVVKGGLAPWQARRVKEIIEERIEESIHIEDLAAAVRLSVSYFSAAFKVTFQQPPHSYLLSQRVNKAKQEIAQTELPLCEVALNCGLSDQAHLSRVFRRHTGRTPSQWRRMHTPMSAR